MQKKLGSSTSTRQAGTFLRYPPNPHTHTTPTYPTLELRLIQEHKVLSCACTWLSAIDHKCMCCICSMYFCRLHLMMMHLSRIIIILLHSLFVKDQLKFQSYENGLKGKLRKRGINPTHLTFLVMSVCLDSEIEPINSVPK